VHGAIIAPGGATEGEVTETTDDRPVVLVVEDDVGMAELWRLGLEQAGYDVIWHALAAAGIGAAAALRPDAIVLDLMLPDMPGQRVMQSMQADPRVRDIPIVIASAAAAALTPAEIELASAFLTKPVPLSALVATLERVIAERRASGGR
jgi:DNA-binding response OmpR family regulator